MNFFKTIINQLSKLKKFIQNAGSEQALMERYLSTASDGAELERLQRNWDSRISSGLFFGRH